jgi:hypothetical protein
MEGRVMKDSTSGLLRVALGGLLFVWCVGACITINGLVADTEANHDLLVEILDRIAPPPEPKTLDDMLRDYVNEIIDERGADGGDTLVPGDLEINGGDVDGTSQIWFTPDSGLDHMWLVPGGCDLVSHGDMLYVLDGLSRGVLDILGGVPFDDTPQTWIVPGVGKVVLSGCISRGCPRLHTDSVSCDWGLEATP